MTGLLAPLAPLAGLAPDIVLPAAMVFTRVSLFVFVLPGLGARAVPARIRLVAALGLTGALFPLAAPLDAAADAVPLLLGEAMAGAYLGLAFRLLLFVLSVAGIIVAQALSLSQVFGAAIEEADTTLSTLMVLAGTTLFLTTGLAVEALAALARSYETLPPGGVPSALLAERLARGFADGLALGLSLAAPFVLLNLAYNALLGLMNRAMPQLMVTFVGMPAVILVGLMLLGTTISHVFAVWLDQGLRLTAGLLP